MGLAMLREQARGLTRDQRNAFLAAWLGWAMDAFDYFLLVFVITDVADTFHIALAAFEFGRLAVGDKQLLNADAV